MLALALLSSEGAAAAPDAGQLQPDAPLRVASVRRATAELDDGRLVELDGGVWLDTDTAIARAKDLERLAAENVALKSAPPPAPPLAMTLLLAVALGAGVAVGYLIPRP